MERYSFQPVRHQIAVRRGTKMAVHRDKKTAALQDMTTEVHPDKKTGCLRCTMKMTEDHQGTRIHLHHQGRTVEGRKTGADLVRLGSMTWLLRLAEEGWETVEQMSRGRTYVPNGVHFAGLAVLLCCRWVWRRFDVGCARSKLC